GNIDEVAVYDYALSAEQIAAHYAAAVPEPLTMTINTVTGNISIRNHSVQIIEMNAYQIESTHGALIAEEGVWRSLDSQGIDSIGSGEGASWTEAPGSGPHLLGEVFLLGKTAFDLGEAISLGSIYNTSIVDENITFTYYNPTAEKFVLGTVEYTSDVTESADFDGDGDVDGNDFLMWQVGFPMASGASRSDGDSDGDGDVDAGDFVTWKSQFGMGSVASNQAGIAIPEPGASPLLVLAALAGAALIVRTRRDR
ncbi:MAG: hypothetical protein JW829_14565, partial [Pirellulales bacterium]|nr:hypothetical protein [Pirellulales bacterium]